MKLVVKIVSVLVMILSAVLFIAMLAGIFGTWWGRGQAISLVTSVAAVGDQALARGQELVVQANDFVVTGQNEVQRVSSGIAVAGAKAEESNLVLVAAESAFDRDLRPGLQRLNERGQELRATVQLVDQTLSLMQRLPGGRDSQLLSAVDELLTTLNAIDQAIKDALTAIQQAKSTGLDRLVTTLTAPLARADTALTAVSDRLTLSNQRFEQGRADLVALRDRVNNILTWAAVIGTFALLWMALAQLSLFLHAYGVFTGRDPLARWRRGNGDELAPVPQPAA